MMANAHVRRVGEYAAIMILAVAMALNYQIFILQNAFAPAGINGPWCSTCFISAWAICR